MVVIFFLQNYESLSFKDVYKMDLFELEMAQYKSLISLRFISCSTDFICSLHLQQIGLLHWSCSKLCVISNIMFV